VSTTVRDPLVETYLKRLRAESRTLPRAERDELMQQIQEHLHEALSPGASEADVRNALEHLGEPEAIVAEEFDRLGFKPATAGKLEWAVIFLLPFGALVVPVLGWLLGVMLLWTSRVWKDPREADRHAPRAGWRGDPVVDHAVDGSAVGAVA
jgi:uncharacterized membrane protein